MTLIYRRTKNLGAVQFAAGSFQQESTVRYLGQMQIAQNHFSGDVNFDVGDIVNLYSEHGSDASHPGSHDSGSGHGGH